MASAEKVSIKTPAFRGSYVSLIKPRKQDRDDGSSKEAYQITVVLPKTDPVTKKFLAELIKAITMVSTEKHGKPIPLKQLKHCPIIDGDTKDEENHKGCWLIRCSNNFKPETRDTRGELLESESEVYSGAWYKAAISPWAWSNKFGKGVSINVDAVLKVKDDSRFGGGADAREVFADEIAEGGTGEDALDGGADNELDDLLG